MTDVAEKTDIRALLPDCVAGDQFAIERLVRQFEKGVFRLALSVVDDPMEAAEIAQETFLSALKSLPSYQEKSSFKAWLFTIALNISRSRLRKRKALERLRAVLTGAFQLDARKTVSPEEAVIQD
ncbi:MAG: sigma-70 family RNA polymerase sigma factor, partial [Chloroflexota bacterium]